MADVPHLRAVAHLPQQACLTHRAVATKEVVIQGADRLTHRSIEGANPPDLRLVHDI